MDLHWISIAFLFGFVASRLGLPPLLGFLAAGFGLTAMGTHGSSQLEGLANVGVTLMLFTVGLKLKPKTLLRAEIGAATLLHLALVTTGFGGVLYGLGRLGVPLLDELSFPLAILIGFVAAFSSTVFAVKLLDDVGEVGGVFAMVAIGVLVVQDLAAVVYLASASGKVPSVWALGLVLLFPARKLLFRLLDKAGHGELLILAGLGCALGGSALFEAVKLKGDLGALCFGALFAAHPKASELSDALLNLKELFLVAFFLTVGLAGLPTWNAAIVALVLVALLPLKVAAFYHLFMLNKLRARTSFITALALGSYSEFGLLVAALAIKSGWLSAEWMGVLALAILGSFLVASPLNAKSRVLYTRFHDYLMRFERPERVPEEEAIDVGEPHVLVLGMGRIGSQLFDKLAARAKGELVGLDSSTDIVAALRAGGRNVVLGSVTDPDFWARFRIDVKDLRLVIVATNVHASNLEAIRGMREVGYTGSIAAIGRYADELVELKDAGANVTFDLYDGAALGFSDSIKDHFAPELSGARVTEAAV